MKISAIERNKVAVKLEGQTRSKKDLTSFGVNNNQTNPTENIDSKKANEAIKTTFLSNISFGGHSEQLRTITYGTSGALQYKMDDAKYDSYQYNPQEAIGYSRHSYPNSTIEKTYKGRETLVYFADPQEVVTDKIKAEHGFIVYDNEPKFPSLEMIKKKYFSNYDTVDLHQYCKTIYDYHERLKNVDIKELLNLQKIKEQQEKELAYAETYKQKLEENSVNVQWNTDKENLNTAEYFCRINRSRLYFTNEKIDYYQNRIENSNIQQRLATGLYSILDEAGSLFMERDKLYGFLHFTKYTSFGSINSKEDAINMLNQAKDKLISLQNKYSTTEAWKKLKESEYEEEEKKENNYGWNSYDKSKALDEINKLTRKLKNLSEEINVLKPFLERIEKMPSQYDTAAKELNSVMDKLAKLYPKVENFYKVNAKRLLCV